jgi:hypothetical protein
MSRQLLPLSSLWNNPMRTARNTLLGAALLTASAWASSIPSASLSLCSMLLRLTLSAASFSRSVLPSDHVSPPSRLRMVPPTSSAAGIRSGCPGTMPIRITRHANDILSLSACTALGSRFQVSPPSSLRKTPTGEVPA